MSLCSAVLANELNDPNLHIFYANASGNWQIRTALTANMMALKGFDVPPEIVFPIVMANQDERTCASRPPTRSVDQLAHPGRPRVQMYPEG